MAKTTEQQVKEALQAAKQIAVFLPPNPSIDALCSAITLQAWLRKQEVFVTLICQDFAHTEKQDFLLGDRKVQSSLKLNRPVSIELDLAKYPVADLRYQKKDNRLAIILTPKDGMIPNNAFEIFSGKYPFDLIVTFNTEELASLGHLFVEHKTFFEEIPVLNIDHRAENEQFGHINWIDLTRSSTSEMLYDLLYTESQPPKESATLILAGIMDATHGFRSQPLSSRTLEVISSLLKAGADHETLVTRLYRTKTVGQLRLWGHALNHLQADRDLSLVWSMIPRSVFSSTGTTTQDIQELLDEILSHTPEAKTVLIFLEGEHADQTEVHIQTTPPLHAKQLLKNWQPVGSERQAIAIIKGKSLAEAEQPVLAAVKERLASVLKN